MIKKLKLKDKTGLLWPVVLPLFFLFSLFFSDEISLLTKSSLTFCFSNIIGTVFPFMILTDFLFSLLQSDGTSFLERGFSRVFKINGTGLSAFLAGILSGFPLGVKLSSELYINGKINREECERLISFSNNTGPAFTIFALGVGIRKSLSDGAILYFSMLISAIITGVLLGISKKATNGALRIKNSGYSLISSIKSAGQNTLYICSFITFFGVLLGILELFLPRAVFLSLVPFLELASALRIINELITLKSASLVLSSFALSFSGISVLLQAKSFLPPEISIKKYTLTKLLQGCISAVLTCIFYKLISLRL